MAREEASPGSTAALCRATAVPFAPPVEYRQPPPRPLLRLIAPRPRASTAAPLFCGPAKDYPWPDLLRLCKDFAPVNH